MKSHTTLLIGTSIMATLPFAPANAQAADALADSVQAATDTADTSDIVVTAQKRETILQKTPLAITAVGGDMLQARGINSAIDLATAVPGANFSTNGGATSVTIRGVGSDGLSQPKDDPSVAAHIDGVYLAHPVSLAASFYDMERIEILRGPQGTLYGRNATGGAINLITKAPASRFEMKGDASYGNYNAIQARAMINVPLGDTLSLRAVGLYNKHDGYATQLNPAFKDGDDAKDNAERITLKWDAMPGLTVSLRANLYHSNSVGPSRTLLDTRSLAGIRDANGVAYGSVTGAIIVNRCGFAQYPQACGDPRAIHTVYPEFQKVRSNTYSSVISWELSSALSIKSITGYTDFKQDKGSSSRPFLPLNFNATFNFITKAKTFTQEVDIDYDDGGPLTVVAGGFYLDDDGSNNFNQIAANPNAVASITSNQLSETNSFAFFGEANYKVGPVTLTGGVRYTKDKKTGSSITNVAVPFSPLLTIPFGASVKFDSVDYKIGADWQASENVFAYLNYSTAFKTGGVNTGLPVNTFYRPEKLRAWQGGLRTDWLDRRLRMNLDAFYYKYRNPQITQVLGVSLETQNASSATVKGIEAVTELRPVQGLILTGTATYAKSRYAAAQISDIIDLNPFGQTVFGSIRIGGNPLRFTPEWTFGASAAYEISPGRLREHQRADRL